MADEIITREQLIDASKDAESLQKFISGTDIEDVLTRLGQIYPTLAKLVRMLMETGGWKAYETEAILLATTPLVNPSVGYAFDTKKLYLWNGTIWKDEGTSPLDLAKAFTVNEIAKDRIKQAEKLEILVGELSAFLYDSTSNIVPIYVDDQNNILISYNKSLNRIQVNGIEPKDILDMFSAETNAALYTNEDGIYPLLVDKENNIILGFDANTGKLVGLFDNDPNLSEEFGINQWVFYGQSLSVGGTNYPELISVTQAFFNKTFKWGATPVDPDDFEAIEILRERITETACSGAANTASYLMATENGIQPQNHKIFASTAGVGGALLSALSKPSAAYTKMLLHVQKVNQLRGTDTHGVKAIGWMQGEENLRTNTGLATYEQDLLKLFNDMKADFIAITGQAEPPKVFTYQLSTRIGLSEAVCKAQFNLCKKGETAIATPIYHLEYDGVDGVHLMPSSHKWMGAYYGRAYKQWIVEKRKPDWLEPMSASIVGKTITVFFKVPKGPLVFDKVGLPDTQDNGFAISDGTNLLTIQSMVANEDTVTIELVDLPPVNITVRYGLDYMSTTKFILEGRTGNLRESTEDTVKIKNTIYPLYHVCPHFELPVIKGEY